MTQKSKTGKAAEEASNDSKLTTNTRGTTTFEKRKKRKGNRLYHETPMNAGEVKQEIERCQTAVQLAKQKVRV